MKPSFIIMALSVLLSSFNIKVEAKSGSVNGIQNQVEAMTWNFKTGGSVYATPLVRDGVVYIGSQDSVFYALDAQTGAERWHYRTNNQIFSSASTDGNIVCFESDNKLFGLDLNGVLKWRTQLAEGRVLNQHDSWDISNSSPRIVDGVAYIGSEGGQVFGIRIVDGSVVFHVQAAPRDTTVETTPTVYNGKIYFGTFNGVLYAYDLATSRKVWSYDTRLDNNYLPTWYNAIENEAVVWNGSLYFGGRSCNLYSLNPETGAKNWMYHDGGSMWLRGGPIIQDSLLYIGSSLQLVLHAFNPLTGALKWRQGVDYVIYGVPAVDGDYVFFGTANIEGDGSGSLYAVDRMTGQPVNRLRFDGQVYSTPILASETLFIGCTDGNVFALDRGKMLTNPLPNTGFKDKTKITVGEIPGNDAARLVQIPVLNKGAGSDSVTISLNMSPALIASQALTFDPPKFKLAANDSQIVTFGIDATKLKTGKYQATVIMTSKSNLSTRSQSKMVGFTVTAVSDVESGDVKPPRSFSLGQNYPNPFNPVTAIEYSVVKDAFVSLKVYNLLGEQVAVLVDEFKPAGDYRASFDAADLTSGIYFYRYQTGNKEIVRKMSLLK